MKRTALLLVLVAGLVSGCGGGGGTSLRDELATTAANLDTIRSGALTFAVLVSPRSSSSQEPFGFTLHGPFAFGSQPNARMEYTQIANGRRATVTVVLQPGGGYVLNGSSRRTLAASQLASLRDAAASVRAGVRTDISGWLAGSPQSCGERCARGNLHVARTVEGLVGLNGSHVSLTDGERKQLDGAARTATYEVHWTDAHLLSSLRFHVVLDFSVPPGLRHALGELVGATFDLRMQIADPKA